MAIVASAPGKVLMTGGYLILERPNAGIVLSTNARFYAIVKPIYDEIKPDSWAWAWSDVKLTSPQLSRESLYKLSLKNLNLQCVSSSASRNPFVEQAVQYAIAAAHATFEKDKMDVLNSYSCKIEARGLPLTPEALAALPSFTSFTFNVEEANGKNCKPEVAKTGLGSSAAMTTAVVAALLHYLGVIDLSSSCKDKKSSDLDTVHIIAQTAHCIAQGKVGSGFDVSSAVYGSYRYVRFSPEVLSSAQLLGEPGTGGSSTPSMVGAVKKWQKADPQTSQETWRKLSEANSALETQFSILSKLAEERWDAYKCVIDSCCMKKSEKWIEEATEPSREVVVEALLGARHAMLQIRNHMRQMGEFAGVPIEPESQTRLLDITMDMDGVLLAGVFPGAGGFDAVFAVTLGDSSSNVIKAWSSLNILALLVREDPRGVSLESCDPRTNEIASAVSTVHIE
ncbi:hypothetical protein GH714_036396 [Hevea brasiliensis]|uniref:phosphomevalonate kinase n=1 Tax=Hevea brasiliensis TaxID=3981 RepID=A0A6A6LLY9_HEVBR|nr:hypothetical protein GH714_036396 [Hevea brasiliensis]